MARNSQSADKRAKQLEAIYAEASWQLYAHPLLGTLALYARTGLSRDHGLTAGRLPRPDELVWNWGHGALHAALGHDRAMPQPRAWHAACDVVVGRFLDSIGQTGQLWPVDLSHYRGDEQTLYASFAEHGVPGELTAAGLGPAGFSGHDDHEPNLWPEAFALAVSAAVEAVVEHAAGRTVAPMVTRRTQTKATMALAWCRTNYPLLGALAANFMLVEDARVCASERIGVAAVCAEAREIYLNPGRALTDEETRFVLCHELLHVGLSHHTRGGARQPFLWNVACDYVINGWLLAMGVGAPPEGALIEPAFDGMSAEEVYDRLACDLRRCRRLATLRGVGLGDILSRRPEGWWLTPAGVDLDSLYRRCLVHGLACHTGRGLLPGRLVEAINALSQPPVPWDVELARWFDERFPARERRRTYARPSRRQASTPDIPRPRWHLPDGGEAGVFGVLLDSSGSLDRVLLGRGVGAIAAYAQAHDVPAVRLVMCDAAPYDAGWLAPEQLSARVEVRGRGGTVLQPGIDLLARAPDFPPDGPLLIITDGQCDRLTVRREHAYLLPAGASLPHVPRGPVFRMAG